MQRKTAQLLWDVQDSASFIAGEIEGKSFEDFENSRVLRRVVERGSKFWVKPFGGCENMSPKSLLACLDFTKP